jgi:molybdopterin converting factor small subunit
MGVKVTVKLFATLAMKVSERTQGHHPGRSLRSGELFEQELPEGSTLNDLLGHLELDRKEAAIIFVNARNRELGYRLAEGDQVGIFPPVGGG